MSKSTEVLLESIERIAKSSDESESLLKGIAEELHVACIPREIFDRIRKLNETFTEWADGCKGLALAAGSLAEAKKDLDAAQERIAELENQIAAARPDERLVAMAAALDEANARIVTLECRLTSARAINAGPDPWTEPSMVVVVPGSGAPADPHPTTSVCSTEEGIDDGVPW